MLCAQHLPGGAVWLLLRCSRIIWVINILSRSRRMRRFIESSSIAARRTSGLTGYQSALELARRRRSSSSSLTARVDRHPLLFKVRDPALIVPGSLWQVIIRVWQARGSAFRSDKLLHMLLGASLSSSFRCIGTVAAGVQWSTTIRKPVRYRAV